MDDVDVMFARALLLALAAAPSASEARRLCQRGCSWLALTAEEPAVLRALDLQVHGHRRMVVHGGMRFLCGHAGWSHNPYARRWARCGVRPPGAPHLALLQPRMPARRARPPEEPRRALSTSCWLGIASVNPEKTLLTASPFVSAN